MTTEFNNTGGEPVAGPSRLLIALSSGADSGAEISWGAVLARAMKVPVTLLHLLDPATSRDPGDRATAIASDLLAIAATDHRLHGLEVETQVRMGLPHEELRRATAETPGSIPLIHAGTPGMLKRALLGTDAHAMIRAMGSPFIILPPDAIPAIEVQCAVVGYDGSPLAEHVTTVSEGIAASLGIDLIRVEAIEPASRDVEFLKIEPQVQGDRVVVRGRAGETLLAVARARNAGLIMVGSHGRGQMTRLFLGSTSEWLVDHSDRPLLIVPQAVLDAGR